MLDADHPHSHPQTRGNDEMYPEGVVHGHIHNYDNMTYIHGHVHHGSQEQITTEKLDPASATLPVPETALVSKKPIDNCKNDRDCQHFEIINYHRADMAYKKSTTPNHKTSLARRTSSFGSSLFNDDFLLLPSKKRKPLQQRSESVGPPNGYGANRDDSCNDGAIGADDCECNPKILEVCCDVEHPHDSHNEQKDKDLIIYTEVKNDSALQAALDNMGSHNNFQSNESVKDNSIYTNDQYASGIVGMPEINCDLTCGPNSYYGDDLTGSQNDNDNESEEEDIFEKFCKECLNLGLEQKNGKNKSVLVSDGVDHHRHHHEHKCTIDTPISTSPSSSNNSIKVENDFQNNENVMSNVPPLFDVAPMTVNDASLSHTRTCHDHIVNSQMDLKILDDLCNISSVYEFPLANHLNHQNHSHVETLKDNGTIPKQNETQSINLLESSLRGTTSQGPKSNQSHHHHIIQLHPHKPNCSTGCLPMENNNYNLNFTNINANSGQFNNKNYSHERSTIPENTMTNDANQPPPKFHHTQKQIDWNSIGQENNIIDFNWSFKNEENSVKCKWDQCSETYSTLFDLQKHMLKEHVGTNSPPDLSCYWENCGFEGDDTCTLINHINADHGINFGMKVIDPLSLLDQRDPTDIHNHRNQSHHHCNHKQEKQNPTQPTHNSDYDQESTEESDATFHLHTHDPPHLQHPVSRSDSSKYVTLQCQWGDCRETFDSAQALTKHLEEIHLTRGKSEYQCHWLGCSKKFTQRQKLVRHLKVHSGYKPYKCSVCSKCFSSEDTLTQHMRIHSGEKPFECPMCGKKFTVSSSLKIHIRTHTGEKPLQCKTCGKRFNESSNLSKHMKTHQKKYKCIFCARSFDSMERFQAHQNKCTKAHEN